MLVSLLLLLLLLLLTLLLFIFVGRLLPREKVVLDKKEAFNFFKIFKDNIDHECYEEGCTFNEVVKHYGHSEKSVG